MAQRPNLNRVKSKLSYTIEEIAQTLSISIPTVRGWQKQGLRVMKSQKPFLVLGQDLREFLTAKQTKRRSKLQASQFQCFTCKAPQEPLGMMADYISHGSTTGRLVALCSVCERTVYRFTCEAKLSELSSILSIVKRGVHHT